MGIPLPPTAGLTTITLCCTTTIANTLSLRFFITTPTTSTCALYRATLYLLILHSPLPIKSIMVIVHFHIIATDFRTPYKGNLIIRINPLTWSHCLVDMISTNTSNSSLVSCIYIIIPLTDDDVHIHEYYMSSVLFDDLR